jgi:magnesium transporter
LPTASIATVRYDELRALRQFTSRAQKPGSNCTTTPSVFLGIVEAIIDRTADVLERISNDVDAMNREVFSPKTEARQRGRELRALIERIGAQGDLAAKARKAFPRWSDWSSTPALPCPRPMPRAVSAPG